MSLQETAKFRIEIILSTEDGELPSDEEAEQLIMDQLSGELHEATGLACVAIRLIGRTADLEE